MKFTQGRVLRTDSFAMFETCRIGCTHKFDDFCFLADGCVNDALAKAELFFDDLIRLFVCASRLSQQQYSHDQMQARLETGEVANQSASLTPSPMNSLNALILRSIHPLQRSRDTREPILQPWQQ